MLDGLSFGLLFTVAGVVVVVALVFDFINGFHDTANAVATVISTRVLTPTSAILMAAVMNFLGALTSTAVAATIAKGLVVGELSQTTVLAGLVGAIAWQLWTWYYGLPSSSSHALVGSLAGAVLLQIALTPAAVTDAIAATGEQTAGVLWYDPPKPGEWLPGGYVGKIFIPLLAAPFAGFLIGFLVMALIYTFLAGIRPATIHKVFGRVQVLTAAGMAFAHGSNDAQKSMGIIFLALVTGEFLPRDHAIPYWVMISCAVAMAAGTAMGGHRIIKTLGHKIIRLEPVHGAAAEMSAAAVIETASRLGIPLSTTHVISSSIFGVGASTRLAALRWELAGRMVMAWVMTLPAAALTAALVGALLHLVGLSMVPPIPVKP
jgi:PiT family inorganic phosphate transporter